jgi:hypothetical protein
MLQRRRPTELNDLASMLTATSTLLMLWRDVAYRLAKTSPGAAVREIAAGCQGLVLAAFDEFTGGRRTSAEAGDGDAAGLPTAEADVELALVEYRYLCDALVGALPRLAQLLDGALRAPPAAEPPILAAGDMRATA